jgi:Protein of unknown function (DUF4242)
MNAAFSHCILAAVLAVRKTVTMGDRTVKRFVIEREMPSVGSLEREQIRAAAEKSNSVLRELGTDIQWVESYVTQDRIYCIYLAKDAALVRKHADISGFPANKISEVKRTIDPTTAVS